MIDYAVNNRSTILDALGQHIWLSLVPVLLGTLIALPIGYLAVRYRSLYQPIVNIGGVLYSIPSLALFVVIPAVVGIGVLSPLNIVIALTIYTLALMARTVADALLSVQGETTRAAHALGYRPVRQLLGVELPMALPVMFAGLRVATVSSISLVSVGAFVGIGGLGALFTRGLQLDFIEPILIGIILSVLLAGLCDLALVLTQRRLTPWTRVVAR
ncbi:ABC transporter permease [Nocardioides panacis]|uniref:ABC transporter permease n=1 Tax=Nocardioides panacis TaxID=2849501 RepID=A0A975SZZ3_9ACTN|nr:ABC transporter permease [Nocardioides panacis]QWZ08364.1 ABC transporter permease [Nocardioides panacis]